MANSNSSNGLGIGTVLFIVFLVLKLTHVIDWSWWVVSLPIWGSFVAALALLGILYILFIKTIQKNEK